MRRKIKEIMEMKTLLPILLLLGFCMPTVSHTEILPVIGTVEELIMKYGNISETECGTQYKRRWKFCTSLVRLKDDVDQLQEYAGTWACMRYLNDEGVHLNIVCRRNEKE